MSTTLPTKLPTRQTFGDMSPKCHQHFQLSSLPCSKGKQVRVKPDRVEPAYISIPASVMEHHKLITLVSDVMFMSGVPFFITLLRDIRFVIVQFIPCWPAPELSIALNDVIKLYSCTGFVCQTALMDNEFEKLLSSLLDTIVINTTAKNKHVGKIEHKIHHIKERCRCITVDLPYTLLPITIIKALVIHAAMFLNAFPDLQGISKQLSPHEFVLCWQLSYSKHCRGQFGSFCQVYDKPTVTNTQDLCTHDAIYLGPTSNMQGTCNSSLW